MKKINSDGGDDDEDKYDRYCEGLEEFEVEYSFPCHGTRPGALWHAASPEALRRMLETGADVNASDAAGWTALHHLAYYCLDDYYFKPNVMIQMLLDVGADANRPGRYEMTPLDLAAMHVRPHPIALETVKLLMRNGSNATGRTFYWIRDYWYVNGNFEKIILQEILHEICGSVQPEKVDEDASENENPPLSAVDLDFMTAAFWGKPEDLAPILARGANINARSRNGCTPLMFASVYNYASLARFLIENGADVNAKNAGTDSALTFAVKTRDQDMIETIVEMGADINSANKWGITPLMQHINYGGRLDMLDTFIRRGADVNAKDKNGDTPLIFAVQGSPHIEVVTILLDAGAKVDEKNVEGKTALDIVLDGEYGDREEITRLLLARGADPRLMNASVKSKEERKKEEIAKAFSQYGLKAHARFRDIFADNDAQAIAKAVEDGMMLKLEDSGGLDFYKAALRYGTSEVLRACLSAGANADEGWEGGDWISWKMFPKSWPLYHAIDGYNTGALKTLVEAGADLSNIRRLEWRLRVNAFPEDLSDERTLKFKKRLDAGAEILKTLHDAGAVIPCRDHEGRELTYVRVSGDDHNSDDADKTTRDILIKMGDDENETGTNFRRILEKSGIEMQDVKLERGIDIDAGLNVNYVTAGILAILQIEGIDASSACGEVPRFLRVVGACPSCDEKGGKHVTALRRAASPKALERLIEAGIDVRAYDIKGRTALHFIARDCADYFEPDRMIELLIGAGADVNISDENGETPLMLAMENIGESPAALDVIKALLSSGADLDIQDKKSRTAWDRTENRDDESVEMTLCKDLLNMVRRTFGRENSTEKRADFDLMIAVCRGSDREIEEALAGGANVNATSEEGCTPLMFAVVFNTSAVVKCLTKHGADPGIQNIRGETALHLVIWRDQLDSEVVRVLIDAGADVNVINNAGYTPLMLAACSRDAEEIAKILVDAGADFGIKRIDKDNTTEDALGIAVHCGFFRTACMLLAAGAELGEAKGSVQK